jgi:hypothetical protein
MLAPPPPLLPPAEALQPPIASRASSSGIAIILSVSFIIFSPPQGEFQFHFARARGSERQVKARRALRGHRMPAEK